MFIFERPIVSDIVASWLPILYAGVLSTAVAYTLQVVGQKYCEATVASIMMCAESVFALISAMIILDEIPTAREAAGCALMFFAIVLSQIAEPLRDRIKRRKKLDNNG